MNRMKCTIKQEPDALDLTNRPQHLLSPSIENEDDDDDEYFPSEDEQHTKINKDTKNFHIKVIMRMLCWFKQIILSNFMFQKATYDSGFIDTSDENTDLNMIKQGKQTNFD